MAEPATADSGLAAEAGARDVSHGALHDGPSGIGGWMILPIIGLVLTIGLTAYNLATTVPIFTPSLISRLFAQSLGLGLFSLGSLVFGAGVLVFALVCLVGLFRHSPRTPRRVQVFYVALLSVALFEAVGIASFPTIYDEADRVQAIRDVVRAAVACAIWIPYFRVSKRVRNTFVDRTVERERTGEVFS